MSEGLNIRLIPLDAIRVGERKRTYREDHAAELAASVELIGLQQPVTVAAESDDGYTLIDGLHRLEAFRRLGRPEIPASIVAMDDLDRELAEIDENLRRAELTASAATCRGGATGSGWMRRLPAHGSGPASSTRTSRDGSWSSAGNCSARY
jgi:ParB-like chromosome segregation protein Spo0J